MITYIIPILVGWLCGVIVNYLADVLPLRRKLTKPFCIQCDNLQPWVNYLFWPRRCAICNHARSLRVWVIEIIFMAAGLFIYLYPPYRVGYPLGLVVLVFFGVVVLIDLEYRLIIHPVSIVGAGLGLIVGVLRVGWLNAIIGGLVGFGLMWLLYMLGVLLIKLISKVRKQPVNDVALGFGDVNLSGGLGLMLGWPQIIIGLVIAVLIGGVVSLFYIILKIFIRQYQAFMALPYGPFLVVGAVIIIYFRDAVLGLIGN